MLRETIEPAASNWFSASSWFAAALGRLVVMTPEWIRANYADYLDSNHWRRTRYEALYLASFRCAVCTETEALHVHHRTYERVGRERQEDLTVLCADCHRRVHELTEQGEEPAMTARNIKPPAEPAPEDTPVTWVLGTSRDFKPLADRMHMERGFRPHALLSKYAPVGEEGAWFPTAWLADLNYQRLPS